MRGVAGNQSVRASKITRIASLLVLIGAFSSILGSAPQHQPVSVLYAGSLTAVMENGVGPAFTKATGYEFQGEAQGSMGAARMIRDHVRTPDVFISADAAVNETVLMGPKNGNFVKWFAVLASSELVLGYSPQSRYAALFDKARAHEIAWYEPLETPGVRFGRGDPRIDPKGYRTLFLFRLAAEYHHRPELARLLGDDINPAQVFPEIVLMGRLESGQLDCGIFYKHEAVAHKLPYVTLPAQINLSDPKFAAFYARESYTTPSGETVRGTPILLTLTIPDTVRHLESSVAFARFLLSSDPLLASFGFKNVPHEIGGDATQVPDPLRKFTSGTFAP